MLAMGQSSSHPSLRKGKSGRGVTRDTSWHLSNEGIGAKLRVVAKNGCILGAEGVTVQSLPGKPEVTTRSPFTTLGMAAQTLGSPSPQLCRSVPWQNVSNCDRCSLKVDRGVFNEHVNFKFYH